jgi:hypothetical protein
MKMPGAAMFKIGLLVLGAIPLTFASAKAIDGQVRDIRPIDNAASDNAAAAFGQFGVAGLAVAGQVPAAEYTLGAPPAYAPVCWTQYVTTANGNTLVNFPYTICR